MADEWGGKAVFAQVTLNIISNLTKSILRYGFGLMDAGAMTELAKNWTNVPQQRICERSVISGASQVTITSTSYFYNPIIVSFHVTQEDCPTGINKMEHVKIKMNAAFSRRGDLQMILVSPAGTESVIVGARRYDNSRQGNYFFIAA